MDMIANAIEYGIAKGDAPSGSSFFLNATVRITLNIDTIPVRISTPTILPSKAGYLYADNGTAMPARAEFMV